MGSFSIWHWLVILILLPLAFLPTFIAIRNDHPFKLAIILINIFGGLFYGVGWLVALVWCLTPTKKEKRVTVAVADELDRLHQLKEKGILTQEEFDARKRTILGG